MAHVSCKHVLFQSLNTRHWPKKRANEATFCCLPSVEGSVQDSVSVLSFDNTTSKDTGYTARLEDMGEKYEKNQN